MSNRQQSVLVLPGDGIGHEVMPPALAAIHAACQRTGATPPLFEEASAGAALYRDTGEDLPQTVVDKARNADAILLGAMGLPDIRYPDGTEITPQITLRFELDLYAGVRPIRVLPGLPNVLADPRAQSIDFVLVRESTEGLFASLGKGSVEGDHTAKDTMVITRAGSERLFKFTAELAKRRKARGKAGRVTCIDKANVFKSFAFFRKVFDDCMVNYPDLTKDYAYVDAAALKLVSQPWAFDVMVTENMFGDILSDLTAALVGGMGMAPSADIGDEHAVFQPAHGSAPDIVGKGIANPTATILSAAMMLDWLGLRSDDPALAQAGALIDKAVDEAFATGRLVPTEMGGSATTQEISDAVLAGLEKVAL